jgi:four helix bundle protein
MTEDTQQRDICERTFQFGVRVVKLCQALDEKPGVSRTMASQLLRSGTSVGANVEEAQAGQSKPDFASKLSIACKEARETYYWLRLLAATDIVPAERLQAIQDEANQIIAILTTIVKKSRSNS